MVYSSDYDGNIVPLDSIPLTDLLLDESLVDRLTVLGLQHSCDLWILALGELTNLHPEFSNLLHRISQDFVKQGGIGQLTPYETKIEYLSQPVFGNMDNMLRPTTTERLSESTIVRVTLCVKAPRHSTVCWEALLPDSCLPEDRTSGVYDHVLNADFCLHLLSRAHSNDIYLRHWAQPPISNWQDLLPKPTIDVFTDWLHLKKLGERDLNVFEERMGLISGSRKTLEEVGHEFEITRERVRQIVDRFLKHLSHPTRRQQLLPFSIYLKKLFREHGGIMSLGEISSSETLIHALEGFSTSAATELILNSYGIFKALEYDHVSGRGGSDIDTVTWHLARIEPEHIHRARKMADSLIDKKPGKYGFEELAEEVSTVTSVPIETVKASLRTYRVIKKDASGLMVSSKTAVETRMTITTMIITILRELGVPAHFTVITEKINARFPERDLKPNHVHNYLGNPLFRWVGRGTYGLAEWGLPEIRPKENYALGRKLVNMALQEIGRPASIREIDEYLDTLKTKGRSITLLSRTSIILANNPHLFVSLGFGKWGLVEWNIAPKSTKDTVLLACEILAEDETTWLTTQQLYMEMKSRGWTGPIVAAQRAFDREVLKPQRRIRKEELHGFNIQLYGLSSRDWNEETVLKSLLAD